MKSERAFRKELRKDYVEFLKELGFEPETTVPVQMNAALSKVLRKHAPNHESDMYGFTRVFNIEFKPEYSNIRRGFTGGPKQDSGQAEKIEGSGG